MAQFGSVFKLHTCAGHKKRPVKAQPGKPQQPVSFYKHIHIKQREPHKFMCAFTTRVWGHHTSMFILQCISSQWFHSDCRCGAAVAGDTVGFPSSPHPCCSSLTQSFQKNGGQNDPKASWSFPVSCFYSISQRACPWKEQSLVKVCRAEQWLATLNTSCPLAHTMTSSWHPSVFLPMVHYCFSVQTSMFTEPSTENRALQRSHTHSDSQSSKNTFNSAKTHTKPLVVKSSAFWTLRVICLTAIKCWKGARGDFMKAIIACKDLVCLR